MLLLLLLAALQAALLQPRAQRDQQQLNCWQILQQQRPETQPAAPPPAQLAEASFEVPLLLDWLALAAVAAVVCDDCWQLQLLKVLPEWLKIRCGVEQQVQLTLDCQVFRALPALKLLNVQEMLIQQVLDESDMFQH
jgi:hypothetical protein